MIRFKILKARVRQRVLRAKLIKLPFFRTSKNYQRPSAADAPVPGSWVGLKKKFVVCKNVGKTSRLKFIETKGRKMPKNKIAL